MWRIWGGLYGTAWWPVDLVRGSYVNSHLVYRFTFLAVVSNVTGERGERRGRGGGGGDRYKIRRTPVHPEPCVIFRTSSTLVVLFSLRFLRSIAWKPIGNQFSTAFLYPDGAVCSFVRFAVLVGLVPAAGAQLFTLS